MYLRLVGDALEVSLPDLEKDKEEVSVTLSDLEVVDEVVSLSLRVLVLEVVGEVVSLSLLVLVLEVDEVSVGPVGHLDPVHVGVTVGHSDPVQEGFLLVSGDLLGPVGQSEPEPEPEHVGVTEVFEQVEPLQVG